jgi:uncharacterized Zn finger protein
VSAGPVPDPLVAVLTEPLLASLAGPQSLERGAEYVEASLAGPLRTSAGRVSARLEGTNEYDVYLTTDGERLRFGCSCPVGAESSVL